MSLDERTSERDLLYSRWHRPRSISRFISKRCAAQLKVIDIDWCEACQFCNAPLALVETQRSTSKPKPATITCKLAEVADVPAYSVSYVPTADGNDIELFRWQQLRPVRTEVVDLDPVDYATWLWLLREAHLPECARQSAA